MNAPPPHPPENASCVPGAFGVAGATPEALPALRKQPGPPGGPPVAANLLNHSDEQTVVAVAAVLRAIADFRPGGESFEDWGVVGTPRFAGRQSFAAALDKFGRLGPLCVSPVTVSHFPLHALSSTISLALKSHGPAVGTGGGCDGFTQALLTGLALQQEGNLPGVWVVVTGWDPEPFSGPGDAAGPPPVCRAAALALLPDAAATRGGPRLRLVPSAGHGADGAPPDVVELVRFLEGVAATDRARTWRCPVPGGCDLELTVAGPGAGAVPLARSA